MEPLGLYLKTKRDEFGWSNQKIAIETGIDSTTVSKHLNGKREITPHNLIQYCKCFGINNVDEIKKQYSLKAYDICDKGTIKKIISTIAAGVVATGTYLGVKKILDEKCKSN